MIYHMYNSLSYAKNFFFAFLSAAVVTCVYEDYWGINKEFFDEQNFRVTKSISTFMKNVPGICSLICNNETICLLSQKKN